MILTDGDIRNAVRAKVLTITPYDESRLGSNSYDLTLAKTLMCYERKLGNRNDQYGGIFLDCKEDNSVRTMEILEDGYVLYPGTLYLGATNESTHSPHHVPLVEGKSSLGRLGLSVHITAGFGDIGFDGCWTLEMTVVHPLRIYANMPICQVYFVTPLGTCINPYNRKKDAKYKKQPAIPVPSKMHLNF